MSNYTKGPWRIDPAERQYVINADDETIAFVENANDSPLIASAPDLLEALTAIMESRGDYNKAIVATELALSAITKSTGKEPA